MPRHPMAREQKAVKQLERRYSAIYAARRKRQNRVPSENSGPLHKPHTVQLGPIITPREVWVKMSAITMSAIRI